MRGERGGGCSGDDASFVHEVTPDQLVTVWLGVSDAMHGWLVTRRLDVCATISV